MKFADFVCAGAIRPQLESDDKSSVIIELVESLVGAGQITADDKAEIIEAVMKREELGLMDEHLDDPTKVAFIMGISFLGGSLPPLLPYFFISNPSTAIWVAIFVSVLFLFVAGVAKTRLTKVNPWKSGLEMTFLGVLASAVGFGIGWLIEKII